jgi:hypothetical protein
VNSSLHLPLSFLFILDLTHNHPLSSSGKVVLHRHDVRKTVAQELCAIASEEDVDLMMMRRGIHREVSIEAIQTSPCSLVLCD